MKFDFDKLMICFHEAAHAVVFQYYGYKVHYIMVEYNMYVTEESENWSGVCCPKDDICINEYHNAVICYAGYWIENYLYGADKAALRFSSDFSKVNDIEHDKLAADVQLILEDCVEHLWYLTWALYKQDRILMTAPSHYDEEFANWTF